MKFLKLITPNTMKNFKIPFLAILILLSSSCELDEVAPFLDRTVYDDPETAKASAKGIYAGLTAYNAKERGVYVINGFSGLFITGKQGQRITNPNNANLFSLNPTYDNDSEAMWSEYYAVISRCNGAIQYTTTGNDPVFDNIAGHSYFIRAYSYFQLVRLWGDIPLWTELPNSNNLHKAKSSAKDVYSQIISDAQQASSLMSESALDLGSLGPGFPLKYASNMLLAKVYMTLATNPELGDGSKSEADYWQLAYDEAIKVKNSGSYSLHPNYSDLFSQAGENSNESIFEYQLSEAASNSQLGRNYTPWKWKAGMHFGWLSVNASVYDTHVANYPTDPRLDGTYLHYYTRADNGAEVKVYPSTGRNNFRASHPYLFKFAEKDKSHTAQYNSQNYIVYRYADLLLMLAEISNELSKGAEALGYVEDVLDRVGLTPHISYQGGKDSFRDAIMREYRFELLGEGEDSHNNRRRGYTYFLNNIILPHNNDPNKSPQYDLTLLVDEARIMKLPIPLGEVTTNNLIDD